MPVDIEPASKPRIASCGGNANTAVRTPAGESYMQSPRKSARSGSTYMTLDSALWLPPTCRTRTVTPPSSIRPVLEDDVGWSDLDRSWRWQFFLDVLSVLRRCLAGGDALVERFVAPAHRRQLDQLLGSRRMGDHLPAARLPAEDVTSAPGGSACSPPRSGGLRPCPQCLQERPCVSLRRSSVQHERAPFADYPAHRRPVRRAWRHPVDVLADLGQYAHGAHLEDAPRTVIPWRPGDGSSHPRVSSPSSSGDGGGRVRARAWRDCDSR